MPLLLLAVGSFELRRTLRQFLQRENYLFVEANTYDELLRGEHL